MLELNHVFSFSGRDKTMPLQFILYLFLALAPLTQCAANQPHSDPGSTLADYVDYTGHAVLRVTPKHDDDVRLLRSLLQESPPVENLDFWRAPSVAKRDVDIRVPPSHMDQLQDYIRGLDYRVMTPDIQSLIGEERPIMLQNRAGIGPFLQMESQPQYFNTSIYHSYEEVMNWMDHLGRTCGDQCSVFSIGASTEGRQLKVIRIGRGRPNKPAIWLDAGLHAREWIAPATALYIISKLLNSSSEGANTRYLTSRYTWYILPLANPDGYAYSWTTDRLWRKTRSIHPSSECRGADPNRNWNFHWGGEGTSSDPCGENFHGTEPFSEPETMQMARFIWSLRDKLSIYLSLHSYGQYWLTPWGFTYSLPSDYNQMVNLGNMATAAMEKTEGSSYMVGSSSRMLYLAAGGSDDWAKAVAGVKYSYTVELRDTGRHGFILPPHFIQTTGEEMLNAVRSLALGVLRERRRSSN